MDENLLLMQAMSHRGQDCACAAGFAVFMAGTYAYLYPHLTEASVWFVAIAFIFLIVLAIVTAVKG